MKLFLMMFLMVPNCQYTSAGQTLVREQYDFVFFSGHELKLAWLTLWLRYLAIQNSRQESCGTALLLTLSVLIWTFRKHSNNFKEKSLSPIIHSWATFSEHVERTVALTKSVQSFQCQNVEAKGLVCFKTKAHTCRRNIVNSGISWAIKIFGTFAVDKENVTTFPWIREKSKWCKIYWQARLNCDLKLGESSS